MSTIEVKVPDIGDFQDVPVIEVFVKPGDVVKPEDPLATLESDKATMDVPAPAGGTVREVRIKVGDRVSEGSVMLVLDAAAAAAARSATRASRCVPRRATPRRPRPASRAPGRATRTRRARGRPPRRRPARPWRCACPTSAASRTCR